MFIQRNGSTARLFSLLRPTLSLIVTPVLSCGLVVAVQASDGPPTFVDINPDRSGTLVAIAPSSCPHPCASGGSGGRVNGLSVVHEHPSTYFAASELGGLFKTNDGGASWVHLDGHIPTRTWDVESTPGGQKVYATSFYDGRVDSLAGIEVSDDGGDTWSRPRIVPPATCNTNRQSQPSAYGISIRPDAPDEVLIGTNCGVQRTTDGGTSWTAGLGVDGVVWDVVALEGGNTYYACGEAGFLSSSDGTNWTTVSSPSTPAHRIMSYCRLAVSPDEPHVVFSVFADVLLWGGGSDFSDYLVARGGQFFESDDSGNTWSRLPHLPGPKTGTPGDSADYPNPKRNPFVATNKRSSGFDLWLGAGHLHQVPCATPAPTLPGGSVRCTTDIAQWSDTFTDANGDYSKAHGDSGDLVFNPTKSEDACPTLYSSDGGIYKNTEEESPDCHDKARFQPTNTGVHALLLLGMTGVYRPGAGKEDVYLALQDNGLFSTGNAEVTKPAWRHAHGGDVSDVVADSTRAVARGGRLMVYDAGLASPRETSIPAKWSDCVSHGVSEVIDQYGPGQYVLAIRSTLCGTDIGVRLIDDIESDPLGSPLGAWPITARPPCHVQVSKGDAETRVYALAGTCRWNGGEPLHHTDQLWRYAKGSWTQVQPPQPRGTGFSIFAVAPSDPNRLYASVIGMDGGRTVPLGMYRSGDGGANWVLDTTLTDLMHGVVGDQPRFVNLIEDALDGAQAGPVAQPTLVAFDPLDPDTIIAGGRESGVFLSRDGGETWALLTDPFTPGTTGIPHLPRPFFAHFSHGFPNLLSVFIGTMGRGVWRIDMVGAEEGIDIDYGELTMPYWRVVLGLTDDSPGMIINILTGKTKPIPPIDRQIMKELLATTIDNSSGLEARELAFKSIKRMVEGELCKFQTRRLRNLTSPSKAILRRGQRKPTE